MEVHLPCGSFSLVVDASMWRYTIYALSSTERFGCMATSCKQTCWRFRHKNGRLELDGKANVELTASYDCHSPYSSLNLIIIPEDEPLMRYDYFLVFCGGQTTFQTENVYGIKNGIYQHYSGDFSTKTFIDLQDFNRRLFRTVKLPFAASRQHFFL